MAFSVTGTYVGVASQIAVQPFSLDYFKVVGRWYNGGLAVPNMPTTCGHSENTIHATPFILTAKVTFDRWAFWLETTEALGHLRMAIYDNNPTALHPKNLLLESGECSTAGIPGVVEDFFINPVSFKPGLYWLASNVDTAITLSLLATPEQFMVSPMGAITLDQGYRDGSSWDIPSAYGAFPAVCPVGGINSVARGRVWLRVA